MASNSTAGNTETFAGSHIYFSAACPDTEDRTGYEALTWTSDDCLSENIPPVRRTSQAVEQAAVCQLTTKDKKGTSKWDAVSFSMYSDWNSDAQILLEIAEASRTDIISVKIVFQSGNTMYFMAQVATFACTNGGTGNDFNMRDVELWIQSQDIVKVPAGT